MREDTRLTHKEELGVIVDEVFHHAGLLSRVSLRLKQARGENTCQILRVHLVDMRAPLDPVQM